MLRQQRTILEHFIDGTFKEVILLLCTHVYSYIHTKIVSIQLVLNPLCCASLRVFSAMGYCSTFEGFLFLLIFVPSAKWELLQIYNVVIYGLAF